MEANGGDKPKNLQGKKIAVSQDNTKKPQQNGGCCK